MELKIKLCILVCFSVAGISCWSGQITPYMRYGRTTCLRCICWYRWGCAYYRRFTCNAWFRDYKCKTGWRHNGNRNCNIPICYPGCNQGTCTAPNTCDCPTTATGQFCQTLVCSYQTPCYPGNCYDNNKCNCTEGFTNQPPTSGCLKMEETHKPYIGRSTTIITHQRETDNALLYYFLLDATDDDPAKRIVWSNQQIFNRLTFEYEMMYDQPEDLSDRPLYVRDMELGIVSANVRVRVTDFNNITMDRSRYFQTCDGASTTSPVATVFNCTIEDLKFKTLVEDADTLTVTFTAISGGFRQLINLDQQALLAKTPFDGVTATKELQFKFDFRKPKYCTENGSAITCPSTANVLEVADEFTKDPIQLRWSGWADTDHGSGLWYFLVELHSLVVKDARNTLTEMDPIMPSYTNNIMVNGSTEYFHEITPPVPGMYSVLLEVRDIANNSRLARRFVLYDPDSEITLDHSGKGLHVSSAAPETGYLWQDTMNSDGTTVTFDVNWEGFFVNQLHEDGKYLNEIQDFPVMFQDIKDDTLSVEKFVDPAMDDNEGSRTQRSIPNLRGIVAFEYAVVLTADRSEPSSASAWQSITPLGNTVTVTQSLVNGQNVKIWVRGYDKVGNVKAASTNVTIDNTQPIIDEDTTKLNMNDNTTDNTFDSSVEFEAYDLESGVHEIDLHIVISTPGIGKEETRLHFKRPANVEPKTDSQTGCEVEPSLDEWQCFRRQQRIVMNNCWFMLPVKEDLAVSNATLNIVVYNQAMLSTSTQVEIKHLDEMAGLAIYSGPRNVRVEEALHNSFRIVWDLPEIMSCYGQADILLKIQYKENGKDKERIHRVASDSTFFDVGTVPADTHFIILFSTALFDGRNTDPEVYSAITATVPEEEGTPLGMIIGVAVDKPTPQGPVLSNIVSYDSRVLVLVALVIIIFVVLIRRGVIKPQEKAQRVRRAATRIYRQGVKSMGIGHHGSTGQSPYYDNRQSELYIYGEMDLQGPQIWHLDRNDVSLESKIKSGHFADIYKASIRNGMKVEETVVAKTLKENHTPADELTMTAKINFLGTQVGDHPNVLKFIGAVVSDDTLGQFIIYEYCENGTLKDYLTTHRNDMSIELQENLFRFGLDIAKGMEFLAQKEIVHRRLAARNILLTFLNEVKITGFGPQPADEEVGGDAEQGKKERIPIKWMAPECMTSTKDANEKSDVWSYAVVLWEIFTLGDTPYADVRSKDLPNRIKKGTRLPKPEQCDETWYGEMTKCWAYSADKRPTFGDIRLELDNLFVQAPGDDYYYYKR